VVLGQEVDEVLGVASREGLLSALLTGHGDSSVASRTEPVEFVPEMIRADRLLTAFRRSNHSVRVVVDEFGGFVGLIGADAVLAVSQAVMAIEAGYAEVVALIYGNDQRSVGTQYGGPDAMGGGAFLSYVYHSPWGFTSQGALYALTLQSYKHARGFTEAEMGEVSVAQRGWSSMNPNAIMRKPITLDDYLGSAFVCEPLHLFDYCLINDGGVALIIAEAERAKRMTDRPVFIEGVGRSDLNRGATSLEPRIDQFYLPAQQEAAAQSYAVSGLGPRDMDILQVYDSFSVHVPLALEGYGYCGIGEAGRFLRESRIGPGGKLPTNTSGGHLSETYMQGWAHQIECVRQLRGECGERQVQNARHVHYTSDVAGKCFSVIYGR
jgi:acetyl-CoA acetyltransferase